MVRKLSQFGEDSMLWIIPNHQIQERQTTPLPIALYIPIFENEGQKLGTCAGIGYAIKQLTTNWNIIGHWGKKMMPTTLQNIPPLTTIKKFVQIISLRASTLPPCTPIAELWLRHHMCKGVFFPGRVQTVIKRL